MTAPIPKAESWLDCVLQSNKFSEAPERFFWWSALAAIAATARKRVWLERHFYKLYPNIYVLLVSAKSGLRKGIPVSMARSLLNFAGTTRVISGQNSIQGIVKELAGQKTLENGTVIGEAQAIIIAPELGSSMVEDKNVWTMMTDLYNTHEHEGSYTKNLKNSPPETLKEPCLNFLAASNEALLEDALKSKDIEGGFIARTFIVHESKIRAANSLIDAPEGIIPKEILAQHLIKLKDISGEFAWPRDSKEFYDSWYKQYRLVDYEDRTGTIERLGDAVLKVGMLISLSKGTELILRAEDLAEAIEKCEDCVPGVRNITMGHGQSLDAPATAKVLKLLIEAEGHCASRQKMLKKLWPDIDPMMFDRVIENLDRTGAIVETFRGDRAGERSPSGKEIYYRLDPKIAADYQRYKREIV